MGDSDEDTELLALDVVVALADLVENPPEGLTQGQIKEIALWVIATIEGRPCDPPQAALEAFGKALGPAYLNVKKHAK